ncbi:MAG TPA: N-acetyltransferase [Spongiibacteraceae bacterium]|nr:N-acetyltransferase [Spongiibacteraceae bacterium]HCS29214.1 N-acetyltransferase [Spongiibacteraceae bacterium]
MAENCIRIRSASTDDVPRIRELIVGLARYEKLEHEMQASEQQLRDALFGDRPSAEVVIAEVNRKSVGFALFFHNFSTFVGKRGIYLEDLYVEPEQRGHGIGKQLLSYLAKLAVARDCGRFEWSVLDWNQSAIDFYRGLGATGMDEWTVQRVDGEALVALAAQYQP